MTARQTQARLAQLGLDTIAADNLMFAAYAFGSHMAGGILLHHDSTGYTLIS